MYSDGLNNFDIIYYINLNHRTDRLENITNELNKTNISLSNYFKESILTNQFKLFLKDGIDFAINNFNDGFKIKNYTKGFLIGNKYSRKDVCRILNWELNEEATVYGYKIKDGSAPLFVNYHKAEDISESTKYDDGFINNSEFKWMTKSNRTLNSNDVKSIKEHKNSLSILLFIKKHNGEGSDFYFVGEVIPKEDSFIEVKMKDKNQKEIPVVKLEFKLLTPVEDHLYEYLTDTIS
jgi:hypothetical protein